MQPNLEPQTLHPSHQNKIEYNVAADGSLSLFSGQLVIQPPYSPEHFRCTNEMILTRVRALFDPE